MDAVASESPVKLTVTTDELAKLREAERLLGEINAQAQ